MCTYFEEKHTQEKIIVCIFQVLQFDLVGEGVRITVLGS